MHIVITELIPHEISKLSPRNKENDLVYMTSGFEFRSSLKFDAANEKDVVDDCFFTVSNSESVKDQNPSHETAICELQFLFSPENSDLDFSCYTPFFLDSGSQFSEKSTNGSLPSLTFLLGFKEQFTRSTFPLDPKFALGAKDECQLNPTVITLLKLLMIFSG
ncbi:hypothetical protein PTKIN_Ptkin03bG0174000 [Pterospermum kingtungense]